MNDAQLDAILSAAEAARRGGNATVLHALLTPMAVIEIVNELADHRQPGTKPDFQLDGISDGPSSYVTAISVQLAAANARDKGATWIRITDRGERFYVDGWRERPAKEARFEIMGETR